MVQFLKVPVSGNKMNFKNEIIPSMNYLFSKFFKLLLTGTFKKSTITVPYSHNSHHILRWYEWDLLVFC